MIADIFLGKITKWNDPRITKLNPGTNFPNTTHRSVPPLGRLGHDQHLHDLPERSQWRLERQLGAGKSVHWPNGLGGKGNPGVAALIKQNEGGIGYIELAYAVQNNISYAAGPQRKGQVCLSQVESTTAAADGATLPAGLPQGHRQHVGAERLPDHRLHLPAGLSRTAKPEVKKLLEWVLTTGQKDAAGLHYAPLPANVQQRALAAVASMR